MATLNYLCRYDCSDDDCFKCVKHGIRLSCLDDCPDFSDVRNLMSEEQLKYRAELMKKLGVTDKR